MKSIAIFNQDGGTFRTTDMKAFCNEAERIFSQAGHDIECRVVAGKNVQDAMEKAAGERGVETLVAGGGDGTISAAASIAWRHGLVLGVVPAGTMNLFARSLSLPLDIREALRALAMNNVIDADIATANDKAFVHQFSAGLHARMVRYRDSMSYGSRTGKILANIQACLGVVFNPPVFDVEVTADGVTEHRRVSAISVSNNEFGSNPFMVADDLTGGHLGFYTSRELSPAGVARLAFDILRGRLRESEAVTAMKVPAVDLHFPRRRHDVRCVMDGELLPMPRDVALRLHPGELRVLAGPGQSSGATAKTTV